MAKTLSLMIPAVRLAKKRDRRWREEVYIDDDLQADSKVRSFGNICCCVGTIGAKSCTYIFFALNYKKTIKNKKSWRLNESTDIFMRYIVFLWHLYFVRIVFLRSTFWTINIHLPFFELRLFFAIYLYTRFSFH